MLYIDGILPKGPYPPCLRMAVRALLGEYPRYLSLLTTIQHFKGLWRNVTDRVYRNLIDDFAGPPLMGKLVAVLKRILLLRGNNCIYAGRQ